MHEQSPATEILCKAMSDAAMDIIKSMQEYEEVDTETAFGLTAWVAKGLQVMQGSDETLKSIMVAKALGYGLETTDSAALEDGAALTTQALERSKKFRAALGLREHGLDETAKALEKGWRPWEMNNQELTSDNILKALAEHFMDEFGYDAEKALELAEIAAAEFAH